ncbi:MAG: DMT family transporter [Bdellovibrionota bacterium]
MTSATLGPLCAFLSSCTWAVGSTTYSRLSRDHSAFAVNFMRAMIALPLFVLVTFITAGGLSAGLMQYQSVQTWQVGWLALSMIASYALGDVLFLWSSLYLGVPAALAIASSYPLLTAVLGKCFLGQELSAVQILGLLMSVGGIVVVILNGPKIGGKRDYRHLAKGVALAFATALLWATNTFSISKGAVGLTPFVTNTVRMILALLLSAILSLILARGRPIILPWKTLKGPFLIFAAEAFGGSAFFTYGLSHSPLAIGSTLSSLAPVLSVPLALSLGLEKFSVFRTLGVVLVVTGLYFLWGF